MSLLTRTDGNSHNDPLLTMTFRYHETQDDLKGNSARAAADPQHVASRPDEEVARSKSAFGILQSIDSGSQWEFTECSPGIERRLCTMFPKALKLHGTICIPSSPSYDAELYWFVQRFSFAMSEGDREKLTAGKIAQDRHEAEMARLLGMTYSPPPPLGLREGQVLRRYQAFAVELLRSRHTLLLGDEGGLGKTYTAGAFLASEPGALPAAVVCDPHMQIQWYDKLTAFTSLRVCLVTKGKPHELPPADVYIFRVSLIGYWNDFFKAGRFKAVVFDEPQSLRSGESTAKGKAARILSRQARFRLGLTATPIYNYGNEIWNVMQFIDDSVLGEHRDFCRNWCTAGGRIYDPKALGVYLKEQQVFLRRLKQDVGLELPKVSCIVEHVEYDEKTVRSIDDSAHSLAVRATTGEFLERGQAVRDLDTMVRQATGLSKAKSVAQFVRDMVSAGESVLLVGWHRSVYDVWLSDLSDLRPAMYTGSETGAKKSRELERFLSGDTDVLIMSLRSGAGVDGLQHHCSVVVFGELDWSPGIHQQLIWRVDREGQKHPVTAFFLVTDEGSDPTVMEVLGIKSTETTQIVDPHMGTQHLDDDTSNLQRLVQRYLAKGKPTRPEPVTTSQKLEQVTPPPLEDLPIDDPLPFSAAPYSVSGFDFVDGSHLNTTQT